MISFSRISKQYGRQVLFVDASFQFIIDRFATHATNAVQRNSDSSRWQTSSAGGGV